MPELIDGVARERFRLEWDRNFAVSANAGSGKTTAISERIAAMALSADAARLLPKTAVVTFTKKAAAQMGQRARSVLSRRLVERGAASLAPLDHLERAFFGTIHSFCLLLAQRYGQTLGLNLNPTVVPEDDGTLWETFLEQDSMQFAELTSEQIDAFLRHVPLENLFELARTLDAVTARTFLDRRPVGLPPPPEDAMLQQLLEIVPKGAGRKNCEISQEGARAWARRFREEKGFLPPYECTGSAARLNELATAWMAPLKLWLADAGATLAAELATRYRAFRFERGVQTYADQVEAALRVLRQPAVLDAIRGEGWRVVLDEAQDTDAHQFAVLAEITRPVGAPLATWPTGGGEPPRPGHFCLVGDGQQAIYGGRADIRNFLRYVEAFARGDGGELLAFQVTFRAPRQVIAWLNRGFPAAFGPDREHNLGLAAADEVTRTLLQVAYVPLEASPANEEGLINCLPLVLPPTLPSKVESWQQEEARQLALFLAAHGPGAVGARDWGEVCLLAPRNDWLLTARGALEAAGLKVALLLRKNRNGDHPVYAWLAGLLSVVADPENAFEWFGVLREIFAVSDSLLADELRDKSGFRWDTPEEHPEPLRSALAALRPWLLQVDDEGLILGEFALGLARDCGLEEKARRLDPSGGLAGELDRLLAEATTLGLEGMTPRGWLRELLQHLDEGRPSGKPEEDAINLLTAHSAKGLEWPVVIPLGLWRGIGKAPETGLRLVAEGGQAARVYFDAQSLPAETREARERERLRELVRLLYVAFTRVRRHLIVPWHAEFGGRQRTKSFAELWASNDLFETLPRLDGRVLLEPADPAPSAQTVPEVLRPFRAEAGPLPGRILPHQLSEKPDQVRGARHESALDVVLPSIEADDAIDYGLWWHETLEFWPWSQGAKEEENYLASALAAAESLGFRPRAEAESSRLRQSAAWRDLTAARWRRLAELSVFAPLRENAWIDGVVDLTLHDPDGRELWIVDWKTNRRRAEERDADVLQRLVAEYRPQLAAYGTSLAPFFPGHRVRLLVYSTAVGDWAEVG